MSGMLDLSRKTVILVPDNPENCHLNVKKNPKIAPEGQLMTYLLQKLLRLWFQNSWGFNGDRDKVKPIGQNAILNYFGLLYTSSGSGVSI